MEQLRFDWDVEKNKINIRKHGIDFDEAQLVFYDEHARLIADPDHSIEEDRYIILGMSRSLRVLIVVHVYREDEELIRLISARKATKKESRLYRK